MHAVDSMKGCLGPGQDKQLPFHAKQWTDDALSSCAYSHLVQNPGFRAQGWD